MCFESLFEKEIVLGIISKFGSERNPQFNACFEADPSGKVQDCFYSHELEDYQAQFFSSLKNLQNLKKRYTVMNVFWQVCTELF